MAMAKKRERNTSELRISSIIGLFMCMVFGFLLICNLTIIIKGTLNPERPPSVLGMTPMVVLSGSMSGMADDHIEAGDLVFIGKVDVDTLEVGDVIAYMEQGSTTIVTHRIVDLLEGDSGTEYITKGDANNAEDSLPVTKEQVIGIFKFRIPKLGDFALFLQEPLGMVLFIGVPLFAFIIYDIIRRQKYANKESEKTAQLEAELERLRAIAEEKENK